MSRYHNINNVRTRALSEHDILTIEEAAVLLKMRKSDARDWLYGHGLVKDVMGRKRVIYGEVLALIKGEKKSKRIIFAHDVEIEELV